MVQSPEIYVTVRKALRQKLNLSSDQEQMDFYTFFGIEKETANAADIEQAAEKLSQEIQGIQFDPEFMLEAVDLLQQVEWVRSTLTDRERREHYDLLLAKESGETTEGPWKPGGSLPGLRNKILVRNLLIFAVLIIFAGIIASSSQFLVSLSTSFWPAGKNADTLAIPPEQSPELPPTPVPTTVQPRLLSATLAPPIHQQEENLNPQGAQPTVSATPKLKPTLTPRPTPSATPIPFLEGFTYIPASQQNTRDFYIADKHVTVRDYGTFMKEEFWRRPSTWKDDSQLQEDPEVPVDGVSFADAEEYCRWRTRAYPQTSAHYAIPSVDEWQAALAAGWNPDLGRPAGSAVGDWCFAPQDTTKARLILSGQLLEEASLVPRIQRDRTTGFRMVIRLDANKPK